MRSVVSVRVLAREKPAPSSVHPSSRRSPSGCADACRLLRSPGPGLDVPNARTNKNDAGHVLVCRALPFLGIARQSPGTRAHGTAPTLFHPFTGDETTTQEALRKHLPGTHGYECASTWATFNFPTADREGARCHLGTGAFADRQSTRERKQGRAPGACISGDGRGERDGIERGH